MVKPFMIDSPDDKYFELYFPHFKLIKDNYSNLKDYTFCVERNGKCVFEEKVDLCSKMFEDYNVVSYVGTYFTKKSFDLFWPLLDHEYFFYREFEI